MSIDDAIVKAARSLPSDTTLRGAAETFVRTHERDPQWAEWLQSIAVEEVHDRLRSVLRSERATQMRGEGRARFTDDVAAGVTPFEVRYCVNGDDEWKPLGEMRRADLLFVAERHDKSAKTFAFEALFFRALAKKVGRVRVCDKFSADSIMELRQQLGGAHAAA